ncbi:MAG: LytTR family transcriptional regulator DNA-binding domain-containing protein [Saprospiraceae bacterium]|nr:LytTR family transcriptional regulator DNA-binding domain-containing protein [Saprospiraceae bacterium]
MKTIKVLIVEDEIIIARDLSHYVEELGCEVVNILMDGTEVLPFLSNNHVDIVLMDIMLRGPLDGITIARQIAEDFNIPLIYITANTDDRTFELAKATKPFAFIEKPFKKKAITRNFELLVEHILDSEEMDQDQFLLKDRIFVRVQNRMVKVHLGDILYIKANRAYSQIVTPERTFVLSSSLSTLESRLKAKALMRVHRSYIINLEKIDSIETGCVVIQQHTIPVGRSYWESFIGKVDLI